ncbi:phage tail assembly protein [Pedobacter sp. Hv1]|uniref:phage tail assembly protein n=1 Tax=Pedobacter sp. Hv1 TaxID=1740090 RepID=UPI0006D888EE|nr:phage tail assembly protein [Pedobacter sp. Hv1]KQC02098.1 hypothetical protein AQF98_00555 [Pedobacter sp. Hv1]
MAEQSKNIELSGGKIATLGEFKGKHILLAQKVSGEDKDKMMFALIATCVKIDGKPVVMEDLEDMPGPDVLKLMGEFSENF